MWAVRSNLRRVRPWRLRRSLPACGVLGRPPLLAASSLGLVNKVTTPLESVGEELSGLNAPPMKDPYDAMMLAAELKSQAAEAAGEPDAAMNEMAMVLTDPSVEPLVFDPTSLWYLTCYPMQLAIDGLHTLGLPWWGSIVGVTVIARTLLLPVSLLQQRNAAKMSYVRPVMDKLQRDLNEKKERGTITAADQAKYRQSIARIFKENDVKILHNFAFIVNAPVFISLFVALRSFPTYYPEIATGGALWFQNLAVADPTMALPILSSVTMLLMLEANADPNMAQSGQTKVVKNVMRVVSVVMIPAVKDFPAAIFCYWIASNLYSLFQVVLLKSTAFRRFANIRENYNPDKHGNQPLKAVQGAGRAQQEEEETVVDVPSKSFAHPPRHRQRKKRQDF